MRLWMKYFFLHISKYFVVRNIIISNYNEYKILTFSKKKKKKNIIYDL